MSFNDSRDLQIFIGNDQNNSEDPIRVPTISHEDKLETIIRSSQGMRPDYGGEIIISDEGLNSSMNLGINYPMQQFYGSKIDWFLHHPDNMSLAMDSNHLAINTNKIWVIDIKVGEGTNYSLNILRQVKSLPLFQLAPHSQASSLISTTVEH